MKKNPLNILNIIITSKNLWFISLKMKKTARKRFP